MRALLKITTAAAFALIAAGACADELVALSAAAVKSSLADLPQAYGNQSGNSVRIAYGTAGAMRDQALQGAPFDVIILTPAAMKELEARALVDTASQLTLGTTSLGAAVAKGHAAPDIGSVEALRQALLAAASIGIADPARGATTGIYLVKLFERLGLSAQIKDKLKVFPEGQNAMEAVARGEIEIGLGQLSEAAPVQGLAPLMTLPDAVQLRSVYVAAIAAKTSRRAAAEALLQLLRSAPQQAALRANGFITPN